MPSILPSGFTQPGVDQLTREFEDFYESSKLAIQWQETKNKKRTVIMPSEERTFWPDPLPGMVNPGVVAVHMEPAPETVGSIELPGEVKGHLMTNAGVVVGVGVDVPFRRPGCGPVRMEVHVGDRVLCLPFDGLRYRRLKARDWRGKDVRFFGGPIHNIPVDGELESDGQKVEFEEYHKTVVAKLTNTIEPIGDWIMIRKDSRKEQAILTTNAANSLGSWKGTVLHASKKAQENGYVPGARAIYHASASEVVPDCVHGQWGLDENCVMIRWTECYHVLPEA